MAKIRNFDSFGGLYSVVGLVARRVVYIRDDVMGGAYIIILTYRQA